MRKYLTVILLLIILIPITSCKGFMGTQAFRASVYYYVPDSEVYNKVVINLRDEDNNVLTSQVYEKKDTIQHQEYYLLNNKNQLSRDVYSGNTDMYYLYMSRNINNSSSMMFDGYTFTGDVFTYKDDLLINHYSYSFNLNDDDTNSIHFTLFNSVKNKDNGYGYFSSKSEVDYSL